MVALSSLAGTKPACILEAIISDEMFMAVQQEKLTRAKNPEKTVAMRLNF